MNTNSKHNLIHQFYQELNFINEKSILDQLIQKSHIEIYNKGNVLPINNDKIYFCYDAYIKGVKYTIDGDEYIDSFIYKKGMPLINTSIWHYAVENDDISYICIKDSTFIVLEGIVHEIYVDILKKFIQMYQLNATLKNKSSVEKVQFFQEYYSDILQHLTAEDIANFLGINIATYLRIKNGKYNKKP